MVLTLNIFLLLTAYYVLKPVREALILGQGSAELKSYMSAGMVGVLADGSTRSSPPSVRRPDPTW